MLANPFVLPGAGALLALLGGFGFYRMRQKKKSTGVDSSFLESRLQPDSFFGSSGGQRIDTNEATASGSSMVYSPSQLDAAGDVDPVAEADVYLAYGRDLQAEEILKEAMRSAPSRVAIHNKLMEIYAKRRDTKAFEVVATEAYRLTEGHGPEWEHACALGKELDPANPLYRPGGGLMARHGAPVEPVNGAANTVPFGASTLGQNGLADDDSNLDLDLNVIEESSRMPLSRDPVRYAPPVPAAPAMSAMDDDMSQPDIYADSLWDAASRPMDFDLDFPSNPMPLRPQPASAGAAPTADMMPFDLGGLNLDLGKQGAEADSIGGDTLSGENPLETKLSLAEEFRAIGDMEGARSLAEEVLAEARGALKTKASTFLADLT